MSVVTFEKLEYREGELMKTNTSLSAFTGVHRNKRGVVGRINDRDQNLGHCFLHGGREGTL
jgi:hypothetical protein